MLSPHFITRLNQLLQPHNSTRTMPAGFNKGQIEYIKTIANVNGHKTYKATLIADDDHTATTGYTAPVDSRLKYHMWCLGPKPLTFPVGTIDANTDMVTEDNLDPIDCYEVPIEQDVVSASQSQRVTPECFLESVSMKMRHITDLDNTIDAHSHKEFRLVIFRHKEKQHESKQLAENFSNPLYDMFWGAKNLKYGPKGYRRTMERSGDIDYAAFDSYDGNFDRDAMLTDPINQHDYVVMKDCRYYLGREYGGKHIYEDMFRWDHEDPIATEQSDLSYVDSNKNYCWYIMLFCVNNTGGAAADNMGYIRLSTNTHVTSG